MNVSVLAEVFKLFIWRGAATVERMTDGPDIAGLAALIGDPGRANMLTALMGGQALTAGELAREAGIQPSTASGHLARLAEAGLIAVEKQGRHRYFRLAGSDVAAALEALMGLAASRAAPRTRPGPKEPALRLARSCYDHLAGDLGVQMYDSLARRDAFSVTSEGMILSPRGRAVVTAVGLDLEALARSRGAMCRDCLDWSARRPHLAGYVGRGLLAMIVARGWAVRPTASREVVFSTAGLDQFNRAFPAAG